MLEVPYGCPITLARAQSCVDFSGSRTAKLTLCEKGEANVLNTSEICGTAENSMQNQRLLRCDAQAQTRCCSPRAEVASMCAVRTFGRDRTNFRKRRLTNGFRSGSNMAQFTASLNFSRRIGTSNGRTPARSSELLPMRGSPTTTANTGSELTSKCLE